MELTIEIKEDPLEVDFIKDLLIFSRPEEESGAANVVDQPRDPLDVVVQCSDKSIRKKLLVEVNDLEMMFDVSGSFGQVERGQGKTDGDALIEGLVGGKTKFGS